MSEEKKGILFAIGSYVIWGVLPIYWKWLQHVSSGEIMAGRIFWSFIFTLVIVLVLKQGPVLVEDFRHLWQHPKAFWSLVAAAYLISGNWLLYIWAVNSGYLVQTSLGYYMNPLISVLLGIFFLKEKLSKAQQLAFVIAAIGVVFLTISYGQFPWLAFALALSFGIYGLIKKQVPLDATRGLVMETMFILPLAFIALTYLYVQGEASFLLVSWKTDLLLIGTGVVTAVPLILFAKGAQTMPLYLVGFLQYIAPTLMLFLGVIVYGESFHSGDLFAFSCIWLALLLFTVSKVLEIRRQGKVN